MVRCSILFSELVLTMRSTYIDGVCDICEDGVVVDNDADDDGIRVKITLV